MNLRRFLFAGLFLVMFASQSFGQGHKYPNGTVSPFAPSFRGVGIPNPATSSYVFGVAAQGGTFLGAVGQINGLEFERGYEPAFFGPGGSIQGLPRIAGALNGGTASGISADGKIKVGDSGGGAAYWDADNQLHSLPTSSDKGTHGAYAITSDGSRIAGSLFVELDNAAGVVDEGALWTPGGSAPKRLGRLNFDASVATAISEDGKAVCVNLTDFMDQPGAVDPVHASVYRFDGFHDRLPELNANEDSYVYGVSESGFSIHAVGASGVIGEPKGRVWVSSNSGASWGVTRLLGSDLSAGLATRLGCLTPSDGKRPNRRIHGHLDRRNRVHVGWARS